MSRKIAILGAIAASLTQSGCHRPALSLARGPRNYTAASYLPVLRKWTRSARIFDHFDTPLKVTATFVSWDFAWAYAVKRASLLHLSPREARALRRRILDEASEQIVFFVAAVSQDHAFAELATSPRPWRIQLQTSEGVRVEPKDVEKASRRDGLLDALFPYMGIFDEPYWIRFPRIVGGRPVLTGKTRWLALTFSGARGHIRLVWHVRPN